MRRGFGRNLLSAFLCLALVFGLCPPLAFGEGGVEAVANELDSTVEQEFSPTEYDDAGPGDEVSADDEGVIPEDATPASESPGAVEAATEETTPEATETPSAASSTSELEEETFSEAAVSTDDIVSAEDATLTTQSIPEATTDNASPEEATLTTQASDEIYATLYMPQDGTGAGLLRFQNGSNTVNEAPRGYNFEADDKLDLTDPSWRPFADGEDKKSLVAKVEFYATISPSSVAEWFKNYVALKEISFSSSYGSLDLSSCTSMEGMFENCQSLESVDFGRTKTTAVLKDMSWLFHNCRSLESIRFGVNMDTSGVTNMRGMFSMAPNEDPHGDLFPGQYPNGSYITSKLKGITFNTDFSTKNVIDMGYLFDSCESLEVLRLDPFNTAKVEDMEGMFQNCSSLWNIVFPATFTTPSVKTMESMFYRCASLTDVDLSGFNTSSVINMNQMFYGCETLGTSSALDVSRFDVSNVLDFGGMFENCSGLKELDVSGFSTRANARYDAMFSSCINLTSLNLSGFHMESASYLHFLSECYSLQFLELSEDAVAAGLEHHGDTNTYTEKWVDESGNEVTTGELNSGAAPAGIYSWMYRSSSIAYLYKDGELVIYKDNPPSPEKEQYAADSVYAHFEESERTATYLPPWHKHRDAIKSVKVVGGNSVCPASMAYWFYDLPNVTEIDLTGINSEATRSMTGLISGCPSLERIKLGANFRTKEDATLQPSDNGLWFPDNGADDPPNQISAKDGGKTPAELVTLFLTEWDGKNDTVIEGWYRWIKTPYDLQYGAISVVASYTYTGSAITPKPAVTFGGNPLAQGTDFDFTYKNNTNAGVATVIATGKGNYSNQVKRNFTINPASLSAASIAAISSQTYTGKAITPAPKVTWKGKTLTANKDYTVSYKSNTKVGTAMLVVSGKGNFTGSTSKTFTIVAKSASGSTKSTSAGSTKSTSTRSTSTKSTSSTAKKASYKVGATKMPVQSTSKWTLKNCKLKVVSGKGVVTVKGSTVTAKKKGTAKLAVVDAKGKKLATKTIKVYKLTGKYVVQSAAKSNLCLDIKNRSKANGGNLIVWSKNKQTNQKFTFTRKGSAYTIKAVNSGKALEVAGSSKKAGANVCQNKASGKANQQWKITVDAKNRLTFVNKKSGKVLDCAGTTAKKGVNVVQGKSTDGLDQKWVLK